MNLGMFFPLVVVKFPLARNEDTLLSLHPFTIVYRCITFVNA